jgi:HEAT repeat protein
MRFALSPPLIFATLLAAPAVAAPALTFALAADGGIDVKEGAALIARVPVTIAALRRGQPVLRDVTVDGHRLAELRVPIRGTAAEEVWLAEIAAGKAKRVIWSGNTGPRDVDAESSVGLEVGADRVLEYQTAPSVTRCDGVAPRLFPRAYDFEAGKFRPVLSPLPAPSAEKLVARRGDPAMPTGRPIGGFVWLSTSTTRGAGGDARALTTPIELNDADPATAWTEGLGGDGRGEFLTARTSAGGYSVRALRIIPGDGASLQAFRAKNRLRRFQIALGPGRDQRFDVEIPVDPAADAARWREPYWVPLPKAVPSSCVTIILGEVYSGSDAAPPKTFGVTALSDLAVFTDLDGPDGANRLVGDLSRAPDCAARLPLVVSLGEAAVLPTAQTILTTKGIARECLVEVLTTLEPSPKSPIVVEALTAAVGGASDKEERLITAALKRASMAPVTSLEQLLRSDKATLDDRARAARVLGALEDERAAGALLGSLGAGPPPLRAEIADALGRAPGLRAKAVLDAAAAPPSGAARDADVLRAIPAVVKRSPEARAEAVGVLRAALAPERSFEVRARAVMALGALGAAGDPSALVNVRASSNEPALRYLATRELAGLSPAGGHDPRPALRAALADQDPRVRETAALGLGKQGDRDAGGALIEGAKQEAWPFVRRAELEALGRLCVAGSGDLMIRAVSRDVDEVRRAALVGLGRCKDPRAKTVLLQTLAREKEAATVRELAAALLGESGDRSLAPKVGHLLRRLVVESEGDMALEGVAASTLRALARLGGPDAVDAAVTLAGDTRHPFRATAVDALGTLCDPGKGRATLRALATGSDHGLAAAAQNAEKHCRFR